MWVGALLQLSTPTMLVNNGCRANVGKLDPPYGSFIESAVYVGVVGARFEVTGRMEYQEVVELTFNGKITFIFAFISQYILITSVEISIIETCVTLPGFCLSKL